MTTELATTERAPAPLTVGPPPTALMTTKDELAQMWAVAQTVSKAVGMVPANIKTPEQAMAVMLAGWELGMRPMTSLRHVYIVNGKTDIETRAMVGIIRSRDPRIQFEWPEYTREAVTCILRRPGQPETHVRYTAADAKASGQMKPGPWMSYTRDMLYAAATKRACRLGAPDLINAIEGSMTTVSDAEMAIMPVQARVLEPDPAPATHIAAEMYDEGDDGPLSVEVEVPDPKIIQQQILNDITRARKEWDKETFTEWAQMIREEYPQAFKDGKPAFGELDAETLDALAARVRADVGEGAPL